MSSSAMESDEEARVIGLLKRLPELANQDSDLVRRGAYVHDDILIGIGAHRCYVRIAGGLVEEIETRPQRMRSAAFSIIGSADAWSRFWQRMPAPGWHDLFAMNKRGHITIEGNLLTFMQHLQYFKDLLALPRSLSETSPNVR